MKTEIADTAQTNELILLKPNSRYPIYVLISIYVLAFVYKIVFGDHTNFISLHVSNFAITGLVMSVDMFKSVRKGEFSAKGFHSLTVISIALNILVELVSIKDIQLPFGVTWINFNTADPIDALFGIVAALLFLIVMRFNTKPENNKQLGFRP